MLVISVLLYFFASGLSMSTKQNSPKSNYYRKRDNISSDYSDINLHFLVKRQVMKCQLMASMVKRDASGNSTPIPLNFDWRTQGAVVTPVRDLGKECDVTTIYSLIGNLEGQYFLKYKIVPDFSVQQIVDCDLSANGCDGASASTSGIYLVETGGAMIEKDYPYLGKKDVCKFDITKVEAKVTACQEYHNFDEEGLKELLVFKGPLSITVDDSNFEDYQGGIFTGCKESSKVRHSVLLVGYGTENGTPYWIIKYDLGTKFGEEGYIRVPMGNSLCGINGADFKAINLVVD